MQATQLSPVITPRMLADCHDAHCLAGNRLREIFQRPASSAQGSRANEPKTEAVMADKPLETDGSAKAAFALAQSLFWWLLQEGLVPKAQAEHMLRQAIKANEAGHEDDQLAAAKLAKMLQSIQIFQPPSRH
jgi:hypothetical protein